MVINNSMYSIEMFAFNLILQIKKLKCIVQFYLMDNLFESL